jgi:hypothetical protein
LQGIALLQAQNIVNLTDVLGIYFSYVSFAVKIPFLWQRLSKIYKLINDVEQLIKFASDNCENFGENLQKRINGFRRVFIIYRGLSLLSVHLPVIAPFLMAILHGPPFSVPYLMWIPFDYETNVYGFAVVLFLQYSVPAVFCSAVVSMDLLPLFFFNAASGLLQELTKRIKTLDTEYNTTGVFKRSQMQIDAIIKIHDKKLNDELLKCIQIHTKIVKLIRDAQHIFSIMIFASAVISGIILCTTAYSMSMVIDGLIEL